MDLEKAVTAIIKLFPESPWITVLIVFLLLIGWQSPEFVRIVLEHYRENKRINAEIANQHSKTSVEIETKKLRIEQRRRRDQK